MTLFLYTNVTGSYLFDDSAKVIAKKLIKADVDEKIKQIIDGQFIDEELQLIASKKETIILLNEKEQITFPNVKAADYKDKTILAVYAKIQQHFNKKENHKTFVSANMSFIADKLRTSSSRDAIIVQTINSIDEAERVINTLATRLREWYEVYNPELSKNNYDHKIFAEKIAKAKKEPTSIGADFKKIDLEPIKRLALQVVDLYTFKEKQEHYLESKIQEVCPNVTDLATPMIAARLFSLAGSLVKLSRYPASTIQTLGAEKAMFRHLKTGDRPPKYGILVLHPLVAKSKHPLKGRIARTLAGKISLAAKIDFFGGDKQKGLEMRAELEKQFGAY